MPEQPLPRWDMTPFFPSLSSPEYSAAFEKVVVDLDALTAYFDDHAIDRRDAPAADDREHVDAIIARLNELMETMGLVGSFTGAYMTTDTRDELAQARTSEMELIGSRVGKLTTRFTAWLGAADVDALTQASPVADDHAFMLREAVRIARHQMSPPEEALAADLAITSTTAWAKLHDDLQSQIVVPIEIDGALQDVPMTAMPRLAHHPDRKTRRAAYDAELAAWERNATAMAATINSVKGHTNTLTPRRGWGTALEMSLFYNRIDQATFDAMMTAARESFPDFRRYLHAKARALGIERIAWFDLSAPIGRSEARWTWGDVESFVVEQFGRYSEKMGAYGARAFRERWIDAEARPGKVGGAYCMKVRGDESRVLMNFEPSFNSVRTVAHELGHGYHNVCLSRRSPLQSTTPMTLAETASIFCETIIIRAGLEKSRPSEQIAILDASLQGAMAVVVDITSRLLFERALLERRQKRELSVSELKALMLDAQEQTYGDGLHPDLRHPFMWAVKPHYYWSSYYNYPYMFGLLFGLGLYARYQADPEPFRDRYDDLLSCTGMADAAELAGRFGIDIRTPAFWRASLDIVRSDIALFETLTT